MIDWQFLFLAWELKGKYPAILDQPVARELFDDANALLDEIIADGPRFTARGVVRLLAGPLRAATTSSSTRRERRGPVPDAAPADREARRAGPTGAWPTTSPRPATTSAGSPSPSTAPRRWRRQYEAQQRRLPGHHGQGAGRPAGRGVRRVHPPAGAPRLVRARRRPGDRGPARRAVPRHPAGARLPGQPRPQPEAGACSTCSTPTSSAWR